jgi:hypothetical protein
VTKLFPFIARNFTLVFIWNSWDRKIFPANTGSHPVVFPVFFGFTLYRRWPITCYTAYVVSANGLRGGKTLLLAGTVRNNRRQTRLERRILTRIVDDKQDWEGVSLREKSTTNESGKAYPYGNSRLQTRVERRILMGIVDGKRKWKGVSLWEYDKRDWKGVSLRECTQFPLRFLHLRILDASSWNRKL